MGEESLEAFELFHLLVREINLHLRELRRHDFYFLFEMRLGLIA